MDLNLQALLGLTYLAPIALTLRKVYSPDFDVPDAFICALAKLDTSRMNPQFVDHFAIPSPNPSAARARLSSAA